MDAEHGQCFAGAGGGGSEPTIRVGSEREGAYGVSAGIAAAERQSAVDFFTGQRVLQPAARLAADGAGASREGGAGGQPADHAATAGSQRSRIHFSSAVESRGGLRAHLQSLGSLRRAGSALSGLLRRRRTGSGDRVGCRVWSGPSGGCVSAHAVRAAWLGIRLAGRGHTFRPPMLLATRLRNA